MNRSKNYLLHLLRQYRAFVLLYCVAMLVVYPITMAISFYNQQQYMVEEYSYSASVQAAPTALAVLVIILGAVTPFIVFHFIYSKSQMDTYFAMPTKRTHLFLRHFLFGWAMIVIPLVISHLLGFIIYQTMAPAEYLALHPYTFGIFLGHLGLLIIGSLVMMFASTLAILCTTNLFNGILYAGVLHVIPYVISFAWERYSNNFLGATVLREREYLEFGLDWLKYHNLYLSSVGAIDRLTNVLPLLLWFVAAVFALVFCTWLFSKHKVERTDSSYMVKGFYPVIISVFGVLVLVAFLGNYSNLYTGVWTGVSTQSYLLLFLFGFIAYFIVHLIRRQGLPHILKTIVSYLVIFAVAMAIHWSMTTFVRDARGEQILSLNEVEKAEIITATSSSGYYGNPTDDPDFIYFQPYGYTDEWEKGEVVDPAKIQELLRVQGELIDYWQAKETEMNTTMGNIAYGQNIPIQIFYYGPNQSLKQARLYYLPNDAFKETLESLGGITITADESVGFSD